MGSFRSAPGRIVLSSWRRSLAGGSEAQAVLPLPFLLLLFLLASAPLRAQSFVVTPTADTYLRSGSPNQNQGTDEILRIRASGNNRALLQVPVADISQAVGTGRLVSATLELFVASSPNNWGTTGRTVDAHRVLADWTELGATWSCGIDTDPGNSHPDCNSEWDGGTFAEEPTDTALITNGLTGWVDFDVTDDVRAFLAGETDYGWILKKTEENQNGRVDFSSREATADEQPKLVLLVETVDHDIVPPTLAIVEPPDPVLVNDTSPTIGVSFSDGGSGVDLSSLAVTVDGALTTGCSTSANGATCPSPPLVAGTHSIHASLRDLAGNEAQADLSFQILVGPGLSMVSFEAVADSYLRQGSPNQNQGSEPTLRIQSSGHNRALVRMDEQALESVAAGATLHSATLELEIADNGDNWGSSGRTVEAHRLTSDWSEGTVTWNCSDDADPGNQAPDCATQWDGGSFEAAPTASVLLTKGLRGRVSYDVTADVAAFLAGTPNYGWLLKKTDEGAAGRVEYASRESASEEDRPRLVVTFDIPAGGGDTTPPTVSLVEPAEPRIVNVVRPHIVASFSDEGSGVDPATVELVLDGVDRTSEATVTAAGLDFTPAEDFAGESHFVTISLSDLAGNSSTESWVLTLDTQPPTVSIETPSEERIFNEGSVQVAGTADDEHGVAAIEVNGEPTALMGDRFAKSVTLANGESSIVVHATDTAGNVGEATIHVVRFVLPDVEITAPQLLAYLAATTLDVSGTVSPSDAAVSVNGVVAEVAAGTFVAHDVPLTEGGNVLTATATDAAGHQSTDGLNVVRDLTPPHVQIYLPADGSTVYEDTVAVSGLVNDIVPGTVNAGQVTVSVNGTPAEVSNRSFLLPSLALAAGDNVIAVTATDVGGNTGHTEITVHRAATSAPRVAIVSGDRQVGTIGTLLPEPLTVEILDTDGSPVTGQPVHFLLERSSGSLGEGRRQVTVVTGANGRASAQFTLGKRAGVGAQSVVAEAAGFAGPAVFTATALPGNPAFVVVDSGGGQTGLAGRPLPRPLIAAITDDGFNRLAGVPVRFSVVLGAGTLGSGATEEVVTTDSDGRAIVQFTLDPAEGISNNVVEARIDGLQNSPSASWTASGMTAGDPAQTAIRGVVLDNTNLPVPGATVRIRDTSILTQSDDQGYFRIQPAPVGTFYLIVDGSTVTRPGSWPDLELEVTTIPGREKTLSMPVYLLPIDLPNGIFVSETQGGTVTLPGIPGFALDIQPGSVTFPNGSKSGVVSATMVHSDRVPMTPNFGQQPRLIVTIQPAGARFDPPARLTLPNVEGLAPGEVTDYYSFDHDLGHFVSIGPGTVSEDGSFVDSNPGVGIVKAGWHCCGDPAVAGTADHCPTCKMCPAKGSHCIPDPNKNGDSCGDTPGQVCHGGDCVCAVPVQFDGSCSDAGSGLLRCVYDWSSSTGSLNDLKDCEVGERVDYPGPQPANYQWPDTGWLEFTNNPTETKVGEGVNGSRGQIGDMHKTGQFADPRGEGHFAASQKYFYRCLCKDNNKEVTVRGPLSIVRAIKKQPNGSFLYTCSKDGANTQFTLPSP